MLAGTVSVVDIFESALRNANEMDALMTKATMSLAIGEQQLTVPIHSFSTLKAS
jgi:hypothetical protein